MRPLVPPVPADLSLALAACAIEGRAPALNQPLDDVTALPGRADGAGAVIDLEARLEIAELAAGLDMVAQGRPAIADRAPQDFLDRCDKAVGALALNRMCRAPRRDAGHIECFAGVDVAYADQRLLVEQGRL